jgi:hypothetical protein
VVIVDDLDEIAPFGLASRDESPVVRARTSARANLASRRLWCPEAGERELIEGP